MTSWDCEWLLRLDLTVALEEGFEQPVKSIVIQWSCWGMNHLNWKSWPGGLNWAAEVWEIVGCYLFLIISHYMSQPSATSYQSLSPLTPRNQPFHHRKTTMNHLSQTGINHHWESWTLKHYQPWTISNLNLSWPWSWNLINLYAHMIGRLSSNTFKHQWSQRINRFPSQLITTWPITPSLVNHQRNSHGRTTSGRWNLDPQQQHVDPSRGDRPRGSQGAAAERRCEEAVVAYAAVITIYIQVWSIVVKHRLWWLIIG